MQANELEKWLAQEREVAVRIEAGPGPGVAKPEQVAGKTGLEMMRMMLRGELPYAAIARTLDFQLLEVDEGRALFQGTPGPAHLNPMGGVHGGWYATLLDSALGCAVHTQLPAGVGYTSIEIKINYLRGVNAASGLLTAHGWVTKPGRRVAFVDGDLRDASGRLVATATGSCLIIGA